MSDRIKDPLTTTKGCLQSTIKYNAKYNATYTQGVWWPCKKAPKTVSWKRFFQTPFTLDIHYPILVLLVGRGLVWNLVRPMVRKIQNLSFNSNLFQMNSNSRWNSISNFEVLWWQWFPRKSGLSSPHVSLTWIHPPVTSIALNLEQLVSLVKSGSAVTSSLSGLAVHPG